MARGWVDEAGGEAGLSALSVVDDEVRWAPPMRDLLRGDAVEVARRLLGTLLVSTVGGRLTSGRIVETEAYFGPGDPASHAAERTGRTRRNAPMFGLAGTAYVYRIYGMHQCFNVVTDREGTPSAVLVRAVDPGAGMDVMEERRGRTDVLCAGPGRLAQAMGIDEQLNGHTLDRAPLVLRAGPAIHAHEVRVTGRIGVSRAADWPLRFTVAGSEHLSTKKGPACTNSRAYREALRAHRAGTPNLEPTA